MVFDLVPEGGPMGFEALRVHTKARSCENCRAVMIRLVEGGQSVREVARLFGLSPRTLYRWIRHHV
jgi:transposase-like protein